MSHSLALSFSLSLSLCICLSRAVDAWEKDISVHPLILPQSTCEEVLQLLSSFTKTLPSSLCSMNCYQVNCPSLRNSLAHFQPVLHLIFCIFSDLWVCYAFLEKNTIYTDQPKHYDHPPNIVVVILLPKQP